MPMPVSRTSKRMRLHRPSRDRVSDDAALVGELDRIAGRD